MTDVCREMGVRTDIPFRDLTERRKRYRLSRSGGEESIFFIKQRNPTRQENWILPIIMRCILWKMPLLK
ncbi:MAG: hypothetical protein ACLRP8_04350 [Roseburia intestinalis]